MLNKIKEVFRLCSTYKVLYRCKHLHGTYGLDVPIWTSDAKLVDLVIDDVLKGIAFEPTHAQIRDMRRGKTLRIVKL